MHQIYVIQILEKLILIQKIKGTKRQRDKIPNGKINKSTNTEQNTEDNATFTGFLLCSFHIFKETRYIR